jgi:hypothetical protein
MKQRIYAAALFALFAAIAPPSYAQAPATVKLCAQNGSTCPLVTSGNPLPVSGTFSASLGGFTPSASGARGTPVTVTTADSSGTLPSGAVVVVSNVGTTNPMYCNVNGVAATTADQLIGANSWFAFTIPAAITTLHCIATGGSTTANMLGGAGLPTGAGGGSAGGGGGGGAITAALGSYAAGALSAGAFATGAGVDGWDITQGTKADAAWTTGSGSVIALLKAIAASEIVTNRAVNVAQINGVTPLMGNGVTGTGSQRVTIASDNTAFAVNPASATTPVSTMNSASANAGLNAAIAGVFDDATPTSITENSFGFLRMSANRNAYTTLRDAAGNERGANVNASNQLAIAGPVTVVSGGIASGAIASGAVASGAYSSGAFASGAYSSGSIAAGAMVDLLTVIGTKNAGTAAASSLLGGLVYNSTPLTLTNTQQSSLQGDANGYLKVNVAAGGAGGGAVYGPTAVGAANANPPVVVGGTVTGAAGQNVVGAAIKPASTAPVATDTAIVVTESPNSPLLTTASTCLAGTNPGSSTPVSSGAVTGIQCDLNGNVYTRSASQYPAGATPITASATGTTAATTATLAGTSGKTTYICSLSVRANATANTNVTNTVTGVITGTLSRIMWVPANTSGLGIDEQIYSPCLPASGTNTGIAVVSGAPGTGGLVSVNATGYQL